MVKESRTCCSCKKRKKEKANSIVQGCPTHPAPQATWGSLGQSTGKTRPNHLCSICSMGYQFVLAPGLACCACYIGKGYTRPDACSLDLALQAAQRVGLAWSPYPRPCAVCSTGFSLHARLMSGVSPVTHGPDPACWPSVCHSWYSGLY